MKYERESNPEKFTKFEIARVVGARALQIAFGAPVLIETKETDAIKIAEEEFRKKVLPITVLRMLPKKVER